MNTLKFLTLVVFFRFALIHGATTDTKHYVVYMGHHSYPDSESVITANHEILASVIGSIGGAQEASVHHYTKSFRGFSAMLTLDQARKLEENDSIISVFKSRMNEVHTTHSWEFLGVNSIHLYNHLSMDSKSDIIVGVIDTGVWPESKSFNDYGLGPVPKKFKGKCVTGENFTLSNCNRKIIGARYYCKGFEAINGPLEIVSLNLNRTFFRSARDAEGHGTHTASTVAGSMVGNVSLYGGIGNGTARGGAPSARLAIYKAAWFERSEDADLLAAIHDAIHDGVDIISVSIGPDPPQPSYFKDPISIGGFHAFQKGVILSASAGNSYFPGTVTNAAPWILTVAASTVDRELRTHIYLGNSKTIKGFGINSLDMENYHGLISGKAAAAPGISPINASFCKNNTLDSTLVKGKIVVCAIETAKSDNRAEKGLFVKQGGGVGIILINPVLLKDISFKFTIPSAVIGQEEAEELLAYMHTERNPMARISRTMTVFPTKPAPQMAIFSSIGPNLVTPDIIKPDITAPGVNILAAWSPLATGVDYNIISGTSMSCPHVSAVAAIVKSCHPSWSPAAIKSAIMTTATVMDNTGNIIARNPNASETTPFNYGSGHINPAQAIDPGLVYDFDSNQVKEFLCTQLSNFMRELVNCKNPPIHSYDFNYPSIGVSNMIGSLSVHRTVTYYGNGPTVYFPKLDYPSGVNVSVTPNELKFMKAGEKMSFRVDFTAYKSSNGSFVFGALTWSNGIHRVRSPIGLNVIAV